MVALKTSRDLTGVQDFPLRSSMIPAVPSTGLVAFWSDTLLTLNGGNVETWQSYGGYAAEQTTAGKQPAYSGGIVTFDGSNDILQTEVVPASSGYLVLQVALVAAPTGTKQFFGSQITANDKLWIATTSTRLAVCGIGNLSGTTLGYGTPLVLGTYYTIGIYWSGGTAKFRVNSVQRDTDTYNASGGTVGTLPMFMGGYNFGGAEAGWQNCRFKGAAVYSGTFVDADLDAIDAAMAAL